VNDIGRTLNKHNAVKINMSFSDQEKESIKAKEKEEKENLFELIMKFEAHPAKMDDIAVFASAARNGRRGKRSMAEHMTCNDSIFE
jgi:hypothetical protein